MLGALQAKQQLNLKSIGLLVSSFIVCIVLGRAIIGEFGLLAMLNLSWTPEALGSFLYALPLLGWGVTGLGVAVFVYFGFRTHFKVDKFAVKKQFKKTFVIASLVFCGLFLSSLVTAPLVSAGTTATTGYYLATPYSPYDWLVGKYSTGAVYAINGSNWANLMTFPATTWAAYADNETKVQELVLANIDSGVVYLKGVSFNLALMNSIGDNVAVVESVNGLQRTFINPLDSQGSPYTISVSGVNYFAADSENHICLTSTNAATVINSINCSNTDLYLKGNFSLTDNLLFYGIHGVKVYGDAAITFSDSTGIRFGNSYDCTILDLTIIGGGISVYAEPTCINIQVNNLKVYNATLQAINIGGNHSTVRNCLVSGGCSEFGIIANSGYQNTVENNHVENISNGGYAIELAYNSIGNKISGNTIYNCGSADGGGIIVLPKSSTYNTEIVSISKAKIFDNTILQTKRAIYLVGGGSNTTDNYPLNETEIYNNIIEVTNSSFGIYGGITDVGNTTQLSAISVHDNTIIPASSATTTTGITMNGVNNIIKNNDVSLVSTPINIVNTQWCVNLTIAGNNGYNPVGNIALPLGPSGGVIYDSNAGSGGTSWVNNTVYTVWGSQKLITVFGGTVVQIDIDGVKSFLTTGAFVLTPGQTIKVVWSSQAYATVYVQ